MKTILTTIILTSVLIFGSAQADEKYDRYADLSQCVGDLIILASFASPDSDTQHMAIAAAMNVAAVAEKYAELNLPNMTEKEKDDLAKNQENETMAQIKSMAGSDKEIFQKFWTETLLHCKEITINTGEELGMFKKPDGQ